MVFDIVLAVLLAWGLLMGLKNGLFVELASIVAFVAGLFGAIHFSYIVGDYLSQRMEWNPHYINITAFIVTFVLIVMVVHILGKVLTRVADFALIGWLNKLVGAVFGVLKVAVILSAFLLLFERANRSLDIVKEDRFESSILYRPLKDFGNALFGKVFRDGESMIDK